MSLTIDARGMRCPWPAIRLARALRQGETMIAITSDDPAAPAELAQVAASFGAEMVDLGGDLSASFRVFLPDAINASFTCPG